MTTPTPVSTHIDDLTYTQAKTAIECLHEAVIIKKKPMADCLAYLIFAATLVFPVRDQRAFKLVKNSNIYPSLSAKKPLRQLPNYTQLIALLNSLNNQDDPNNEIQLVLDQLVSLSDDTLGWDDLKTFRDFLVIQGVPPENTQLSDFPSPNVNYTQLIDACLSGWKKLNTAIQ